MSGSARVRQHALGCRVKTRGRPTGNLYCQLWSIIGTSGYILDLPQRQDTLYDLAKHHMLAIQEVTRCCGDEKL